MTRRAPVLVTVLVVVLAVAGGSAWWAGHRRGAATPAAVPVATAAVVRTNLASTTQLSGTLGYSGSYAVTAQRAQGTVTALPQPGHVITRGQPAFELDGSSTFLFYGARPEWRDLHRDVTHGADVRQLESNLVALGYADAQDLTVDDTYTWATDAAVRRWQHATGQTETGAVALGTLTYEPGPVRVVSAPAGLGTAVQRGEMVLMATSTTPIVTVAVPPAQTFLVHAHDRVTVTLPAGNDTPGRVQSVSSVATVDNGADQGAAGSGGSAGGSAGGGASAGNQATVNALVTLTNPRAAADLDQAPVTVNVTDRAVRGVLAVPITALVALSGGGYGVYVDRAAGRELVGVTPGLFATTLVQVSTSDLHAGDRVEVPSQ
jgi:peptidoglycan hydrolase-like protein with peptidoglycan-binding domain